MNEQIEFKEGDRVEKTTGDYTFEGEVLCVFKKRRGLFRVVVENDQGICHIFSINQLTLVKK